MWQDGSVSESRPDQPAQPTDAEPLAIRMISDVESIRAMADPTRLAILFALMQPRHGDLLVLSAKDLAAQLGQPQTKLYRHLRQLESAGLIRVAATRVVSGILEQRYQACQRDVEFRSGFLRQHADESEAVMAAIMNNFRDGFLTVFRGTDEAPDASAEPEIRKPKLLVLDVRVSEATAARVRSSLSDLSEQVTKLAEEDPDGVPIHVLAAYYREAGNEDPGTGTPAQT
jgi:DNA-binding transcriptional ArsR family regulator